MMRENYIPGKIMQERMIQSYNSISSSIYDKFLLTIMSNQNQTSVTNLFCALISRTISWSTHQPCKHTQLVLTLPARGEYL